MPGIRVSLRDRRSVRGNAAASSQARYQIIQPGIVGKQLLTFLAGLLFRLALCHRNCPRKVTAYLARRISAIAKTSGQLGRVPPQQFIVRR